MRGKAGNLRAIKAIGDEQHGARGRLTSQQAVGERQRGGGVLAGARHHASIQRGQVQVHELRVVGRRHHHVRGAGVHHQPGARAGAQLHQVAHLLLAALQPRRRQVYRVHAARKINGNHHRRLVLGKGRGSRSQAGPAAARPVRTSTAHAPCTGRRRQPRPPSTISRASRCGQSRPATGGAGPTASARRARSSAPPVSAAATGGAGNGMRRDPFNAPVPPRWRAPAPPAAAAVGGAQRSAAA